ncbi:hypothetical protein [Actinomadura hibisca]|uniref:hypothetical protein n=1 Tax=Actinomadura hibisca TaxID=68565 RepID=UPI000AEA84F3|nr:hypothetical protein [Actinomadura hibisca]
MNGSHCEVYSINGDREDRCNRPAADHLMVTCVHEHFYLDPFCAQHKADFLDGREIAYCDLCWIGPQPHQCPAALREVIR